MRLAAPRDEAPVQAVIVLAAVILTTLVVGGADLIVFGADQRGVEAEAREPPPSADEAVTILEREAQKLRQSVASLSRELERPEVKRRLGIEGKAEP